jgi:hypothetical protein
VADPAAVPAGEGRLHRPGKCLDQGADRQPRQIGVTS